MNIKKLFPENKISKKGLWEFLDKKGFYIVLILCIAVIGVVSTVVVMRNSASVNFDPEKLIPDEIALESVPKVEVNASVESSAITTKPAVATSKPNTSGTKAVGQKVTLNTTNGNVASAKVPQSAKSQNFIRPVFGEITFEYAQDKLVYSKTLEEWRTHSGIDLGADRGVTVKAVADGVVSEVKSDPGFGITILVDHQNGIKTVYANLASDEMVFANQKVKQGDIIGCVGNTAIFESADQAHLHFEVLKNDVNVDPIAYLPKK